MNTEKMSTKIFCVLIQEEKRTNKWLSALRLQLPSATTKYSSVNTITNEYQNVNEVLKQNRNTDNEAKKRYYYKSVVNRYESNNIGTYYVEDLYAVRTKKKRHLRR